MTNSVENKIASISYGRIVFGYTHDPLRLAMPINIPVEILLSNGSKKTLKLSSFKFDIEDFDSSYINQNSENNLHDICNVYKEEFDNFISSILFDSEDLEVSFEGKINKEKKLELQLS